MDEDQDNWFDAEDIGDVLEENWNESSQSQSESEYEPSQDSLKFDSEQSFSSPEVPLPNKKRVIVEKDLLLKLFQVCNVPGCGSLVDEDDIKMTTLAAAVSVTATCCNSHTYHWSTSTKVGEGKKQKFLINVLLASYTLLCGLNISQVVEYFFHLSLDCISRCYFFRIQSNFLHRIIWMSWLFAQKKEIEAVKKLKASGTKTALGGDGKFDSPGFSAAYCTYSVQSLVTKKIISLWVAAKHVVKSSAAMEPYAAKTVLRSLVFDHHLHPDSFTTDRSSSMKSMMIEFNEELPADLPKILHLFDIWHWVKAVLKDLWEAAKLKSCEDLSEWIPSIKNQLWWAFRNSVGNLELLRERIASIPGHLMNIHLFPQHKQHTKCSHGPLGPKAWLPPDSKAISKVRSALNGYKGCRMTDLEMMVEFTHTGDIECFNALLNKYCSKRFFYSHHSMLARTCLAALDHNLNTDRQQATTSEGLLRFDLIKQRHGKKYYAKTVKEDKDHSWRELIVSLVIQCIVDGTRPRVDLPVLDEELSVRQVVAKPAKADAVSAHKTRLLL